MSVYLDPPPSPKHTHVYTHTRTHAHRYTHTQEEEVSKKHNVFSYKTKQKVGWVYPLSL